MTRLTVIAGPTAVGKGTVVRKILELQPDIRLSISVTTRPPRPEEVNGTHYFFVNDQDFDRMIAENELLEYATVHRSHRYGTPRGPVEDAIRENKQIILEIDVQGAKQVKKSLPSANLIFLAPPSEDELLNRLRTRGTETPEQISVRLQTAKEEMQAANDFDHIVINREVAQAAAEVLELMQAE
ncbi:MAG: guanylate kinase [Rhodoluna sp.]